MMMLSGKAQSPSLKILIEFLRSSLQALNNAQKSVNDQQEKLKNSNDLSLEDLKQLDLAMEDMAYGEFEHAEQQRIAQLRLQAMVTDSYSRISILQCKYSNNSNTSFLFFINFGINRYN